MFFDKTQGFFPIASLTYYFKRKEDLAAAVLHDTIARFARMLDEAETHATPAERLTAFVAAFVAPDSFDFFLSISLVVGIIVGGVATITGAIFGAFFIQFIPNIAGEIYKAAPWAVYGVTLIVFMYLMPDGVVGLIRKLYGLATRSKAT